MIEADELRKGFGDRLLIEDLSFSLPPRRHRRRDRPQRRRQDDAVPDDRRRGEAGLRRARARRRPSSSPTSTSRATRSTRTRPSGRRSPSGYEHIKVGDREINSRAYVAGFNFKGSDQQRKVGMLSGGERNRVHLAKLLRRGGNVLLLDEPTNDLDVDTLRALEEALLAFPGCAVIISHDRWFLDRVATHVLAFEGDSQVDVVRGQLRGLRGAPARAASAPRPTGRTGSPTRSSRARSREQGGVGAVMPGEMARLLPLILTALLLIPAAARADDFQPTVQSCTAELSGKGCTVVGAQYSGATDVAVSPDGRFAYVAAFSADALLVMDRNPATGALTFKSCVSQSGAAPCAAARAMDGPADVELTPDGADVLVATHSAGLAVFNRNATTGALTQKAGQAGCVERLFQTEGCLPVNGIDIGEGTLSVRVRAGGRPDQRVSRLPGRRDPEVRAHAGHGRAGAARRNGRLRA